MERIHDKIIIGAGAAGLMAAYSACTVRLNADEKPDVILLESNLTPGKKITATGNGKCNFTNLYQSEECYRSSDPAKAFRIIKSFDEKETLNLFKNLGIISVERNGYCYPHGEQAKTVRDVLVSKVESLGASIIPEAVVCDISKENGRFIVKCLDKETYYAKKLIVCTGGAAAPVFGTNGFLFEILKRMGFNVLKPECALCGLYSDFIHLKKIDGVRTKCEISLLGDKKRNVLYSEKGEIIFNKKGLSGIPVMNLSRFAVNEMSEGRKPVVSIDLFPEMSEKELKDYLNMIVLGSVSAVGRSLSALINDKLLFVLMNMAGLDPTRKTLKYDAKTLMNGLGKLAGLMKSFELNITGDAGFENSQTTQGGVILKEIDEKSMESYKYPGMYFAGEVLDVDGMCGGYNLQWAWTTGYIAGKN